MITEYKPRKFLSLDAFREMDYYAVNQLNLPIELMMENAGLQLANLVARNAKPNDRILIGVGNGNNGGGGLVAARRLSGWGYPVELDMPGPITSKLPSKQLERALKFGVMENQESIPDIWIDAYLGFSQRLPLPDNIQSSIERANSSRAHRISLDIPTGISLDNSSIQFDAQAILTMAAPKEILRRVTADVYMADLGIPESVYQHFSIEQPPFAQCQLIKLIQ